MSYIGNSPYQVAFVTDTFNGTGSATAFTMSVAPANTSSVLVAVSGVLQDPATYSVSGTTLTFSAAPPSGTGNISCRYLGIPASGVTTTAYRTVTEFTATAGQTTFTPPSYTAGFINVYRNGVLLGSADYTATNGTTVVLAKAANANDLVTVESFLVSSVLNAIPATAGSVGSAYLAASLSLTTPTLTSPTLTNPTLSAATFTGTSTFPILPVITTYSTVRLSTTNGKGSTNTLVYRWTTVLANTGSDVTYTDSATLGGYFTINTAGMYAISLTVDANTNGAVFGISLNDTTGSAAGYLASALSTSANYPNTMATTVVLAVGDVIRGIGGSPVGTNNANSRLVISRVA